MQTAILQAADRIERGRLGSSSGGTAVLRKSRNTQKKKTRGGGEGIHALVHTTISVPEMDLVDMNGIVENIADDSTELPSEVWDEWLWKTDQNEPPDSDCLLNKCQLLGMLVCRYRAARHPAPSADPIKLSPARLVVVQNKAPCNMTLRELRDTMSNLVLLWGTEVHTTRIRVSHSQLLLCLDACFHRFGELAWATWPCADPASPLADDVGSIERVFRTGQQEHDQITLSCLRSLVNTFQITYRLMHWFLQVTTAADDDDDSDNNDDEGEEGAEGAAANKVTEGWTEIHQHHASASHDQFNLLSMFYDLPPAARLNYRHTFSGLYNCISQPVYFHNPDYQRRLQLSLESIKNCELDISTLPVLLQVYPEVTVLYDDDNFKKELPQKPSQLSAAESVYAWRWLLTAGRVYLFRWDPLTHEQKVFWNKGGDIIACMKKHYIPHRNAVLQRRRMEASVAAVGPPSRMMATASAR